MKKLLSIFFLLAVMASGCVQAPERHEIRYEDPDNPSGNYLIISPSLTEQYTGTFTLVTTDYLAGGSYTETTEAYTLRYGEAPVGVTLKKVENGVNIGGDTNWYI